MTVTVWGVIHIGIWSNTVKGVLVAGSVSMPPFPCDEIGWGDLQSVSWSLAPGVVLDGVGTPTCSAASATLVVFPDSRVFLPDSSRFALSNRGLAPAVIFAALGGWGCIGLVYLG